jgi:excisionase family DNA binding protein
MGDRQLLTIREAAQLVSLKPATLRRAINRRELGAVKICSRIRIDPLELKRWIEKGTIS